MPAIKLTLTPEQIDEIAEQLAVHLGKVPAEPMTIAQFARAIERSDHYVRRLIKSGWLKQGVTGLIPYSELERYRAGK